MLKQNGISVIKNTTRLEPKSGVTEMCPFSLKTGTYTKSRKEAYIEERRSVEEWSVGDICPIKIFNLVAETDLHSTAGNQNPLMMHKYLIFLQF